MPTPIRLLGLTVALLLPATAFAHGGGLDAAGCHTERRTGQYHCHRAPAPAHVHAPMQAPAPRSLTAVPQARAERQTIRPASPQCFTGPRGGTYTVTASGRKNYGGC